MCPAMVDWSEAGLPELLQFMEMVVGQSGWWPDPWIPMQIELHEGAFKRYRELVLSMHS